MGGDAFKTLSVIRLTPTAYVCVPLMCGTSVCFMLWPWYGVVRVRVLCAFRVIAPLLC